MEKWLSQKKELNYTEPKSPAYAPELLSKGSQHLKYLNYGLLPGGVPQGMNMSPFLSMITLSNYLTQQDSTSYADDPIFYSNTPFVIKDEPENGIINSDEKSK